MTMAWLCLLLLAPRGALAAGGETFSDSFAGRQLITQASGNMTGSSVGATVEPTEPRHAGKSGGRSLWISWQAPADGVATFSTDGSSYDTLLAVYSLPQPSDTTLDKLKEVARNDDGAAIEPASLLQFGAIAGRRYEVAVDGFQGASGGVRLRWDFIPADSPPPVIVSVPEDRAAIQGDPVTLSVDIQTTPGLRLQWRLNGNSFGAEGPTLVIPSLQPENVGRYTLRIDLGAVRFETRPVELQINSEGQTNSLARDKLFDALASPLLPDDKGGHGAGERAAAPAIRLAGDTVGVSRGYNGTQIFNTTYATPDPGEPQPCGLNGGASYWYAYSPPADGTLILDTLGSSYDTFVAVYTYDPPFTGYQDLIPIACDNDGAGVGGASRVEFAAPKARQYLVVIDGINAARGVVRLNYQLDTNRPPVAPTLLLPPLENAVAAGTNVILQPMIAGSPPLHFIWRKGTAIIPDATSNTLELTNVAPESSGDYIVTVSSHVGALLNIRMPLKVLVTEPLQVTSPAGNPLSFSFTSVTGQRYLVEQTEDLSLPWQPTTHSFLGDGSVIHFTNLLQGVRGFFRLRIE